MMTFRQQIELIADQLPVAAYLVTDDGRFLHANERLRRLLGVTAEDVPTRSIGEFYAHPAHREYLLAKVLREGELVKEIVTFTSGDRNIQVQMSCNPVNEQDGAFIGYFGILLEVTEESEYHSIFDAHLPSGVYRLDENDVLTQANLGFARLHGYDSVGEVLRKPATEFYADPRQAEELKQEILRFNEVDRRRVTLRRKSGQLFSAYVTAVGFFNRQNQYAGRAGFVEDRTLEEQYERLLQDIPVGFYVVEQREGQDIVVDCNEEFARIFEVPSRAEMIGRNVRDYHYSRQDTGQLMKKLEEAAASGGAVLGEQFRVRTAHGTLKTIEVNARPQLHENRIIGRTGAIRDITEEMEMRGRIAALTSDVGAVLHTFRHTLTQLKHNMSAVADVLAGSPNTPVRPQTPEDLEEAVRGPLHELSSAVDRFLNLTANVSHAVPLEKADRESLQRVMDVLKAYRRHPKAHWRDLWGAGVAEILGIAKRIRTNTVARDTYRPMIQAAEKIGVLTGLATLSIAREAIAAVETPLEALYEFVITGERSADTREVVPLETCVTDATNSLTDFAHERGVRILFESHSRTEVEVRRLEITRAVQNLLHNAIKYSWARGEKPPWVTVLVRINELAMAEVVVENWGVPIPEEEIAKGLIFRFGFRGRFSSDRGRLGTGVGLADSLSIAQAHKGSLRIESRPAAPNGNPKEYDQPFVTRAFLALPLARRSAG